MATTVPRRKKVKTRRQKIVETTVLTPLDWVDERSAAVKGTKWFLFRHVPRDVNWMQTLGWLVRGMHRWGASVFIILLFLHMGRVFLFGAYKYPRELTWVTGVLILATGMLMGFTGYLLPWDQTAYWATAVGINLNGTAPFLGPWLAQFLAGGPEIGSTTLAKFYALHMLLLPGAIIALIGIHIYLVTRLGVVSPPWSKEEAGRDRPVIPPRGGRAGLVRGSSRSTS